MHSFEGGLDVVETPTTIVLNCHWEGRLWEDLAMCPKKTNVHIWELCVTNDKMCKATKDDDDALKRKRSMVVMEGIHGESTYMVYMAWSSMGMWMLMIGDAKRCNKAGMGIR
jgi:hypothetical protein